MYVYHEMGNAERFGREMCSFIDELQKEIMVLKDVLPLLKVTTHRWLQRGSKQKQYLE